MTASGFGSTACVSTSTAVLCRCTSGRCFGEGVVIECVLKSIVVSLLAALLFDSLRCPMFSELMFHLLRDKFSRGFSGIGIVSACALLQPFGHSSASSPVPATLQGDFVCRTEVGGCFVLTVSQAAPRYREKGYLRKCCGLGILHPSALLGKKAKPQPYSSNDPFTPTS